LPRFHRLPLSALKQVLGKVMKVALLSPDTGQQGGPSRGVLRSCTVGEGGENTFVG